MAVPIFMWVLGIELKSSSLYNGGFYPLNHLPPARARVTGAVLG